MKIYLVLLQLFVLAACSSIPLAIDSHRLPASPTEGDTCYLIVQDFLKVKPVEVKAKFTARLTDLKKVSPPKQKMLGRLLDWSLNQFVESYARSINDTFESLLFIDYKHSFDSIYGAAKKQIKLDEASIYKVYGKSFDNYKKASAYLTPNMPFDLATLKKVHSIMMAGGIDDIPLDTIGKVREIDLVGLVPQGVSKSVFDEINKNIYLVADELVLDEASGKYTGRIWYPSIRKMTPELNEKLKVIAPELHFDIQKFNNQGIGNQEILTTKFITALSEDLLKWFVKQKDDLGDINTPEKLYDFTKAVATFQKNLISLHPFRDGNGRTIRQVAIYHAFNSIGFPIPRILNPDDDIYSSVDEWTEAIIDGIRNTQRLYESSERRLALGLPLETTPELLIARFRETEKISLKKQSPISTTINYRDAEVDINQVHTYFMLRLEDGDLRSKLTLDPTETYKSILDDYYNFFKKSNLDYVHEKKGLESLSVNLIDTDFITTFGNRSFKNAEAWNTKMKKWYTDTIVWRGLSRKNQEIQESEILTMFKTVNQQFVSNNVGRKLTTNMTPKQMNDVIFQDFAQYNKDLLTDGLEKMAKDHSETGPMYGQSYGYSTSSKREVGKAFAMGAMVVAPYGQHQEFQHLLKSRVLVGMKQGKKDVVLSRLKQVRPIFSYKYPRQQEVMGIGAADPDSVMFVQMIDEKGEVIKSFVRNPANPNEILVFKKEINSIEDLNAVDLQEAEKIILE